VDNEQNQSQPRMGITSLKLKPQDRYLLEQITSAEPISMSEALRRGLYLYADQVGISPNGSSSLTAS
jgi:hypothetical protein